MGYVKLLKAGGEFDLLPAEDIGGIFENNITNEITVFYVNGNKILISCASSITRGVDGDGQRILAAVELINGASGEGIFPVTLSTLVSSTQVSSM
jgi:hypothetical protein